MKKTIAAVLVLALLVALAYAASGWFRLQRMRADADEGFRALVDFYVAMDKDHVAKVQELPTLGQSARSSIGLYRASVAAAAANGTIAERLESLRTAQGIGFDVFGSSTGSLAASPDYQAWRRDSADSGLAFPKVLAYNQAAKGLNDEIAAWPGSMFAAVLGLEPLELIDINGKPFQQRPSRI